MARSDLFGCPDYTIPCTAHSDIFDRLNNSQSANQSANQSISQPVSQLIAQLVKLKPVGFCPGACGCLASPLLLCRVANRMNECAFVSCTVPAGLVPMRVKLRTMGGIKVGEGCRSHTPPPPPIPCTLPLTH